MADVVTSALFVNETARIMGTSTTSPYDKGRNNITTRWCLETTGNSTEGENFYETAQMVTGLFIYPAFCFPGLVGNILTVIVLSQRNMLTSTNAFLSALAVSDSIKLINDTLYFFVTLFVNTDPELGNLSYAYLYPYAHFIFSMSFCVSSWLTVSVAVERYILVCHPTKARNVWSRNRAVTLCSFIYIVMTLLALPSAFRYRTIRCFDRHLNASRLDVELTEMWRNEVFVTSYTWAQNLMRSIIPLVVLVTLNTCIIRALRRTKVKKRKNSRHRVTVMMIVVILTFLICITPDAILSTVFGRGYHESGNVTKGIREITDTLLTINAAVNFIIYCALNQVFRKSFAHLCCPNKQKDSGWVTEMDESVYRRLSEAKSSLLSHTSANNPPNTSKQEQFSPPGAYETSLPASPMSLVSPDTSENLFPCLSSDPSSPMSPGFSSDGYTLLPDGTNATKDIVLTTPTYSSKSNSSQVKTLHHHNTWTHPHKASSQRLKNSRNSVKSIRGKRTLNVENSEVKAENIIYIPTEDLESYLRRGSGRNRTPLKLNGHCLDRQCPEKGRLDSIQHRPLTNSESLPVSMSSPSSPLSANIDSPDTTDSDVVMDDQIHNDVTTQNDDVKLTPSSDNTIKDNKCDISDKLKVDDKNIYNNRLKTSHDDGNDESVIKSVCQDANGKEFSDNSNGKDITERNKVKKRALTVSFSDC